MKLNEYKYVRPDMGALEKEADTLIGKFKSETDPVLQSGIMSSINKIRNHYMTMSVLASIRYSQDTASEFNQKEKDFFDDVDPVYQSIVSKFFTAILESPNRRSLEDKFGKQLFTIAEYTVKTFHPSITEDLKRENALSTEYSKLLASAKIMFKGEEKNLAGLEPFMNSTDREIRKEAQKARYSFFEKNADELDRIYDELVKTRDTIAKKLGYKNFVPLAYDRMLRSDYNAEAVKGYRDQILREVVPVVVEEKKKQQKRLALEKLYFYDEPLFFPAGNPNPKGEPDWIIEQAAQMYKELSPETNEFFQYMKEHELMDLVNRKGKAPGGYCNVIPDYKSPFIFSNFNGTPHDVIVLTHEAGHAFQCYESINYEVPDYYFPTYEACEIHSMSMEYITWPWMKLFFKEDEGKFRHSHLCKALYFWPYGVTVDEFQHEVYEHPEMTPAERKATWSRLEKKYMPWKDYADFEFPANGGFWQGQRHIYESPFYYIDYTLAQACAMQFWKRSSENREDAWRDYLTLCKAGGSDSFLGLVKLAGLRSPFEDGSIKEIVGTMKEWLSQFPEEELK
jgi:M3 family oligoendopeptidase